MFGLSGTEIFVIVLAALLVFGPARIPEIARALKSAYREFNRVRSKVDETLSNLRQEIDLNLDEPPPAPRLATPPHSRGTPKHPLPVKLGEQALPVPDGDDYLAPGAVPAAAGPYSTDDYLREAGHG